MSDTEHRTEISRRKLLGWGIGVPAVLAAGGVAGLELAHARAGSGGILTGPALSSFTGPCATVPVHTHMDRGPSYAGRFHSAARHRTVAYTVAYPPGHERGDVLPLAVYLHPFGGGHLSPFGGYSLSTALALGMNGRSLTPMAMVCADGGDGYWHPRGDDDPIRMVMDELIPMCRRIGLGHAPFPVVVTGIAMGGYGAILLAERNPRSFAAVAAISPTIWPDYEEASSASPQAFASAADFAAYDVVTGAGALRTTPARIACARSDPLHNGDVLFARACPPSTTVELLPGGAGPGFITAQVWSSLQFLSDHLPTPTPAKAEPKLCPNGPM